MQRETQRMITPIKSQRLKPPKCAGTGEEGSRDAEGSEGDAMRTMIIATIILGLVAAPAASESDPRVPLPSVSILDARLIDGHLLRVDIITAGLDPQGASSPEVNLDASLPGAQARGSVLLTHFPPRFSIDIDFPAGAVRVGVVKVGEFTPVLPFTDNVRFPVQVMVRQGDRVATASRIVTLLTGPRC